MKDIILVGFGGHAKSVIDSIEKNKEYRIIGYTDTKYQGEYHGYQYLGYDEMLQEYYDKGVKFAFITVGYMGKNKLRDYLYKQLKIIGYCIPFIVDKTAILAEDVMIGEGTFVGKKCVINAASRVGKMCIINTGAVIEHENQIGDFTHISVNSTLCGNVFVDSHCFVGSNSTIIQNIRIGSGSITGAGSVVLRNILPGETVYGIVKH